MKSSIVQTARNVQLPRQKADCEHGSQKADHPQQDRTGRAADLQGSKAYGHGPFGRLLKRDHDAERESGGHWEPNDQPEIRQNEAGPCLMAKSGVTNPSEDTIQIFLKFENEKIETAWFETDGCMSSTVLAHLLQSWPLERVLMRFWKSAESVAI